MDRDAWRAAVHGVTKSRTRLSERQQEMENGKQKKVKVIVQLVSHLFLWLDFFFFFWLSFEGLFSTQACLKLSSCL